MASPLKIPVYVVNENFEVVYRVIPLNLKVSVIMGRVYPRHLTHGKKNLHKNDTNIMFFTRFSYLVY